MRKKIKSEKDERMRGVKRKKTTALVRRRLPMLRRVRM